MVKAWILFFDYETGKFCFEERDGTDLASSDPASWGLNLGKHEVILVQQQASFLGAWVKGNRVWP